MKQGKASSTTSAPMTQPISHKINIDAVSQLGNHVGANPARAITSGPGVQAPVAACTVHHSGSQGKHK